MAEETAHPRFKNIQSQSNEKTAALVIAEPKTVIDEIKAKVSGSKDKKHK